MADARWPMLRSPMLRTKPSPGEDPRVGWYCYRATQSRRSHLTYTHRKSSYRPKDNIFWEKKPFAHARVDRFGASPFDIKAETDHVGYKKPRFLRVETAFLDKLGIRV